MTKPAPSQPSPQADIGLIGLAVMGQNLILNMNDYGFKVAAFNRTVTKVDEFLKGPAHATQVIGTHSLQEFVAVLKPPRRIMLMVRAGEAVDELINELLPLIEKGDLIIDGGNSHYTDTQRRCDFLKAKGILYIGTGISGGEEGARHGPSIMPGGNKEAWPLIKPIFQAIAAQTDGLPCCDWVGDGGAGHYVKMVHNGIEYGDIQLICEAYQLLASLPKLNADQLHQTFAKWNEGELNSYLIEITAQIFAYRDEQGEPLVDKILDIAGQKGTGKWTVMSAAELGVPLTLIAEAMFARCLSALKEERLLASRELLGPKLAFKEEPAPFIEQIRQALYAAKIISYTQGYMLLRQAAQEYKWTLNYGGIALMWRGGCIIRSRFLGNIKEAYDQNPSLQNLLLHSFFKNAVIKCEEGWRTTVATAVRYGIPTPCMSAALAYFDGYRTARLPANLLQAQRDFFGAHTYERIDRPRGQFFHTNWTGTGGTVSSSSYSV